MGMCVDPSVYVFVCPWVCTYVSLHSICLYAYVSPILCSYACVHMYVCLCKHFSHVCGCTCGYWGNLVVFFQEVGPTAGSRDSQEV